MGQGGLFDRKERPNFMPARADYADGSRDDEEEKILRRGERDTGSRHENRSHDQHAPPTDAVGSRREQKGNRHIARECQRQKQSHLSFRQAETHQVEHEHNGQRSVREEAREPRKEQDCGVPWQRPE